MKLFFSKTLKIESYQGVHFLQDHIGTNYKAPWNDYNYITTFNAYIVNENQKNLLGSVKIIAKGIKDTSTYFLANGVRTPEEKILDISSTFEVLKIISLAYDISYYHKVHKLFNSTEVEKYLQGACDASYYNDNIEDYKSWDGFQESLMRNGSHIDAIIKKGYSIAKGNYTPEDKFEIKINSLDDSIDSIVFGFSNKGNLGKSNINILIGKNGVGKTHVLRRLTELVTGICQDANNWPYFHKLLVVAYSPFENFYTKSSLDENRLSQNPASQLSTKSKNRKLLHVNKYEYIGFKDEKGEFSLNWPKEHSATSVLKILQLDLENKWWDGKSRFNILFEALKLCLDFDSITLKSKNSGLVQLVKSQSLTRKDLDNIKADVNLNSGIFFSKNENLLPLSSGQIIYSYLIPCLVAEIEDESLVVIDEPELYLHPTLEIGLFNMLKSILKATSSYAIVATHSAVMAREIERQNITILKKDGSRTEAHKPTFQTLGESLELIIGETFDDYITKKPYQQDLDDFISKHPDKDTVLKKIGSQIGDEALAYIIGKYEDSEDIELKDANDIS